MRIEDGNDSDDKETREARVKNKPKTKPEYLRPMRLEREYKEERMGKDKDVNWKAIVERAQNLNREEPRKEAYFSHTGRGGEVKEALKDNTRYKQTMKSMGKDQGVSKTNREIEMFIKSRQAQKDFLATDVVCREITLKAY